MIAFYANSYIDISNNYCYYVNILAIYATYSKIYDYRGGL